MFILNSISIWTKYFRFTAFLFLFLKIEAGAQNCNLLCNPDFENPQYNWWHMTSNSNFPCWYTTASDSAIEVWWTGFNGVPAYSGNQFIELNAYLVATMYQNFLVPPGTNLTVGFAHRGRLGVDTMSVSIGPAGGPYTTLGIYGDGNTAWGYHTVSYTVPMNQGNYYSLRFNSVYSTGGIQSIGNFLDDISVNLPTVVVAPSITQNINCYNGSNGAASVSASGGIPPYTYSWSPSGGVSSVATGLSAGTYSCYVSDSQGCITISTVTISQPATLNANLSSTDISCFGAGDGSAILQPTGGTGSYTYSWSPGGQTTSSIQGLQQGTYTYTITDANGCNMTGSVFIREPAPLHVGISGLANTTCGYANGTATALAIGGVPAFTYSWTSSLGNTASVSSVPPGTYTVTLTDANHCITDTTITILPSVAVPVSFTAADTSGCPGMCASFHNTSGTSVSCAWNFGDGQTGTGSSPTHCYTTSGTYNVTLTVTDSSGCSSTLMHNGQVFVYPKPQALFSVNPPYQEEGNTPFQFTDQSISAISWSWFFGDPGNSSSHLQNPSFIYGDTGAFFVKLIVSNAYGCLDSTGLDVWILPDFSFYAPNTFTPNSDGLNDVFLPIVNGIQENSYLLTVYDRWGNRIFQSRDPHIGWDGRANGGKDIAQIDTYVWTVSLTDLLKNKHNYIGHINLIR